MLWTIIAIVAMFICLYVLGYCMAKLDSLNKFKSVSNARITVEMLQQFLLTL